MWPNLVALLLCVATAAATDSAPPDKASTATSFDRDHFGIDAAQRKAATEAPAQAGQEKRARPSSSPGMQEPTGDDLVRYWAQRRADDQAWAEAHADGCETSSSPAACDGVRAYLKAFPEGAYARRLLEILEARKSDEAAWGAVNVSQCQSAKVPSDCASVRAYRDAFPKGLHFSEADGLLRAGRAKALDAARKMLAGGKGGGVACDSGLPGPDVVCKSFGEELERIHAAKMKRSDVYSRYSMSAAGDPEYQSLNALRDQVSQGQSECRTIVRANDIACALRSTTQKCDPESIKGISVPDLESALRRACVLSEWRKERTRIAAEQAKEKRARAEYEAQAQASRDRATDRRARIEAAGYKPEDVFFGRFYIVARIAPDTYELSPSRECIGVDCPGALLVSHLRQHKKGWVQIQYIYRGERTLRGADGFDHVFSVREEVDF